MKKNLSLFNIFILLILTFLIYQPGLNGDFLFDDFPSLSALGLQGEVNNWYAFNIFVFGGSAGPTGRPISLLTFLIDDNTWPSVAGPFKYTSLCLHLICGLLLAWANYLLLQAIRFTDTRAAWVAVVAAGLWMLHPYWVSTTLYVVQRMTILSGLFMLAGMVGYLKGRLWLMQPAQHRPLAAYALMTASVGLGTLLAVLSKENGALLPLLLLVVELFLHRMRVDASDARPHAAWLAVILAFPSLVILGYLTKHINFSPTIWPSRPFDQVERLLSETRIMWDYVGQLFFPRIEGAGLFQDGFEISKNILQPRSTLWAVVAWVLTFAALPFLYRRFPFVWLAATFFLCGHLIESTVIGLELHFEHRNYAPAFFIFLPLALSIDWLGEKYRPRMALAVTLALMTMLAGMTWQRSQLWADNDRLQTYWAMKAPQSARGQNYLIGRLVDEEKYAEALAWADQAVQALPHSSLLTMSWLRIHVNTGQATEEHFEKATVQLLQQAFDAQAVAGLRTLVDDAIAAPELARYRRPLLGLLNDLSEQGPYRKFPLFVRVMSYNKARLYLLLNDVPQAKNYYLDAIRRYGRASSAMQMFSEMASAGHLTEASELLDFIQQGVENGKLSTDPLSQAYYNNEIQRMQHILAADSVVN